jgi:peptidoglycan/LPS O-acetylase OafA/YrhL
MPKTTRKLDQLTTSRFFAALSVVLFHGGRDLGILKFFPMLTSGPTAVSYSYVLSGFVMSLGYYHPEIRFDFRKFWLARFSRIYPVYFLSFVLTCIYYLDIIPKIKWPKIWASIFLYQAWIPKYILSFNITAWSLSVEVFFYLLFPIFVIFALQQTIKNLIWISLGFWSVSQIVQSVLFIRFMPEMSRWLACFPLFHLNTFILGVAGGIWYVTNSSAQKTGQPTIRFLFILSLGVVLFAITLRDYMPGFPRSFSLDTGLLAPFFLIIILALALDTSRLSQGLSHPWLVLLGESSYALYILHILVRWFLEKYLPMTGLAVTSGVVVSIYIPASLVLSVLVFKYFECPIRDWLRMNSGKLPFILLDIILILAMIKISFIIRLGIGSTTFLQTENFTLRVGVVIFFLALMVFRFYTTNSWRTLLPAVLTGIVILSGFGYLASNVGWIEGFPRLIFLLIPFLVYGAIAFSRYLACFLSNRFPDRFDQQAGFL